MLIFQVVDLQHLAKLILGFQINYFYLQLFVLAYLQSNQLEIASLQNDKSHKINR